MNYARDYRAKAKELHALRIALQEERYGRSSIRIHDAIDLIAAVIRACEVLFAPFDKTK